VDPDFCTGLAECTWAGLVDELQMVVEKAKPTIIVAPHPIIDNHPDHVFTTFALDEVMQRSHHAVRTVLLYAVHPPGTAGHPFGPPEGVVSLPPWISNEWQADSIVSLSLSPAVQQEKYFAVEGAHGLRKYESPRPPTLAELFFEAKRETSAFLRGSAVRPASFLRRAPRPNEIFYVVSPDSLRELVRRRRSRSSGAIGQRCDYD
jgi:hypothetical protein